MAQYRDALITISPRITSGVYLFGRCRTIDKYYEKFNLTNVQIINIKISVINYFNWFRMLQRPYRLLSG